MQKVDVDNDNPVKTSNKQARGNSSDFCKVLCDSRTKKIDRQTRQNPIEKTRKPRKSSKLLLVFFTCKNLNHAIF